MSDLSHEPQPDHDYFMAVALYQARKALDEDEVPVGAVLVDQGGGILSAEHNRSISCHDPTAHAEIMAIRAAGQKIKNYRFINATLYVTIEPCVMCMGAIIHARIKQVVFGVHDPKWGAAGSLYEFHTEKHFNHRPHIVKGICEAQCRELLTGFFKLKRIKNINGMNENLSE
jgi:tRNA(adenine34) deaminase